MADKESHEGDNIREGQPNGPTSPAETGAQQPVDSVTEGLNAQPAAVVLSEFDREFQRAKDNPSDFNQWVAVEKLLDKEVRLSMKVSSDCKYGLYLRRAL